MDEATRAEIQQIADLVQHKLDSEHADRQYICEDVLWRLDRLLGEPMPRGQRVWDERP